MFLYLAVCLPLRAAIAAAAVSASFMKLKRTQRVLAAFALLFALGFVYRFATYDEAQRGAAGGKVWWNAWRPVHALLFGAYGVLVLADLGDAAPWFIVVDALLGVLLLPTQRQRTSLD